MSERALFPTTEYEMCNRLEVLKAELAKLHVLRAEILRREISVLEMMYKIWQDNDAPQAEHSASSSPPTPQPPE